ncbi:MFS transporter [Aestuariibacter salexigens]|uniref:MFS transporter n=1 Tax=Aestuariibacter salexigens TaxID=226010 RepID=UPI0004797124|nr:MFS transporter [Aestuariibacter salexigens]
MSSFRAAQAPLLLGLTYLFYFGQLGVIVPYLGIFLDGRGFTSQQIGELFAIITVARIFGPTLWATLADKSGRGLQVLQFGCFLSVACFSLVFVLHGFWGITLAFALMMMFWTAILPQMEVITLNTVRGDANRYSRIRLWGSIGFVLLTVLTGQMIDWYSSEVPIVVSFFVLLSLFLVSLTLLEPKPDSHSKSSGGSMLSQAMKPVFVLFLLSTVLLQISFGPFYGFFALYMRDLGLSGQQTGLLIALGVVAEVFIFIIAGRLIGRFGVKAMLIISLLLTAFRWFALAYLAHSTLWVVLSQLLHAFSFGMTHAASMHFIHQHFDTQYQSRGQAIYVSIGFGVGGAIGNYLAGVFWQQGAGATFAFMAAAIVASLAALLLVPVRKTSMSGHV